MDMPNTEAADHPQGDVKALTMSLEILRKINPDATHIQQIHLLREAIHCANEWCPISTWGVKKMSEHITERTKKFFASNCGVGFNGYSTTRAIDLLAPHRFAENESIHWNESAKKPPGVLIHVHTFLFVSEHCDILALQSTRNISGEEILLARKIEISFASDELILNLINHPKASEGGKKVVLNAIKSLSQTLYWVYDREQKRINRFQKGMANLNLISRQMESTWTK